ncbi:MAG: S-layer homology domain-containing protein [bacterium]|nr:S-layer homology domain-containing protein [bacterium]
MKKFSFLIFVFLLAGSFNLAYSSPTPPYPIATFKDVNSSHKYFEAIEFIANKKIVSGYSDKTYKPDLLLNRAELLKILIEANYEPADYAAYDQVDCFEDVPIGQWFTKYICSAKAARIINGYRDNTFRPDENITLVETLKIALKSFGYNYYNSSPWYKNIVKQAEARYFIPLDFVGFDEHVNRGQIADLLTRMLVYGYGGNELSEYLGEKQNYNVTYDTLMLGEYVEGIMKKQMKTSDDLATACYYQQTPYALKQSVEINDCSSCVCTSSNWECTSTCTEDTLVPSDVDNLQLKTLDDGSIKLSWDKALDDIGIKGYQVHYGKSSVKDAGQDYDTYIDVANVLEYTFDKLTEGVKYYFSVIAYDSKGSESVSWATEVSGIPQKVDTQSPTILSTKSIDSTHVGITFSESVVLSADPTQNFEIVAVTESSVVLKILEVKAGSSTASLENASDTDYVILTTSEQEDRTYTITVSGVKDEAGNEIEVGSDMSILKGTLTGN